MLTFYRLRLNIFWAAFDSYPQLYHSCTDMVASLDRLDSSLLLAAHTVHI